MPFRSPSGVNFGSGIAMGFLLAKDSSPDHAAFARVSTTPVRGPAAVNCGSVAPMPPPAPQWRFLALYYRSNVERPTLQDKGHLGKSARGSTPNLLTVVPLQDVQLLRWEADPDLHVRPELHEGVEVLRTGDGDLPRLPGFAVGSEAEQGVDTPPEL